MRKLSSQYVFHQNEIKEQYIEIDKNDSENLDLWYDQTKLRKILNNKKEKNSMNKDSVQSLQYQLSDAHAIISKNQPDESKQLNENDGPQIRSNIIQVIMNEREEELPISQDIDYIQKKKIINSPKFSNYEDNELNIFQLKKETNKLNKKIVQDLVVQRISNIESKQKQPDSHNKHLLDALSKKCSNKTLQNFQVLQPVRKQIDYQEIRNSLQKIGNQSPKQLDQIQDKQKIKRINDYIVLSLNEKEQELKARLMEVKSNLTKSKQVQEYLRLDIIQKNDKIRVLKYQYNNKKQKYNDLSFQNSIVQKMLEQSSGDPDQLQNDEFLAATYQNVNRKRKEEQLQKQISEQAFNECVIKKNEIQQLQNQLHILDQNVDNLRQEQKNIRLQLQEVYTSMMQHDENKQNESFVWFIHAIWDIDEQMSQKLFPDYLQEHSMNYLIQVAQIQKQIKQIQKEGFQNQQGLQKKKQNNRNLDQIIQGFYLRKTQNLQNILTNLSNIQQNKLIFGEGQKSQIQLNSLNASYFQNNNNDQYSDLNYLHDQVLIKKEQEIQLCIADYLQNQTEKRAQMKVVKILKTLFGSVQAEQIFAKHFWKYFNSEELKEKEESQKVQKQKKQDLTQSTQNLSYLHKTLQSAKSQIF